MARFFFFSSRRRHTRFDCDWSSDVCSSDLVLEAHRRGASARLGGGAGRGEQRGRPGRVTQPSLWRVLEPQWRTAPQRIREERSPGGSAQLLILTLVGLALRVGVVALLFPDL